MRRLVKRTVARWLTHAADTPLADRVFTTVASAVMGFVFWLNKVECSAQCGDPTCDELHS